VHSLHGLFDMSVFDETELEDFDGPTIGIIIAEYLETIITLLDDILSFLRLSEFDR
jgi:hypothetical protein